MGVYNKVINQIKFEKSNDILDIKSIHELINTLLTNKEDLVLITNAAIASHLIEHPEFTIIVHEEKNEYTSGIPYNVGNINNIKIIVDPYLKWTDTKIITYTKSDIQVALYLDSVSNDLVGLSLPKVETNIKAYILNNKPVNLFEIKVPIENLV